MTPQTDNLEARAKEYWRVRQVQHQMDAQRESLYPSMPHQMQADLMDFARSLATPSGAVVEAAQADFTEVASLALDMTEAIWPRVKGIEQYELSNLAERCIYKGIELGKRSSSPSVDPTVSVDEKGWPELMEDVQRIARDKFEDGENVYLRTCGVATEDKDQFMVRFNRYSLHSAPTMIEALRMAVKEYDEHRLKALLSK